MSNRPGIPTDQNVHIDVHQDGTNCHANRNQNDERNATPVTPPPSYTSTDNPHGIINVTESHGSDPPTYEDAIDPNAPPPSYDSLYGRVLDVHKSSTGIVDFLKNFLILILSTLGCSIIIGITVIVPIAMIFVGVKYIDQCPAERYIPIFLLVGGIVTLIDQFIDLWTRARRKNEGINNLLERRSCAAAVKHAISCFLVCWFIIGSVVTYKAYEPSFDPKSPNYCNKNLYIFSFWFHSTCYILAAIITCCLCSFAVITIAIGSEK